MTTVTYAPEGYGMGSRFLSVEANESEYVVVQSLMADGSIRTQRTVDREYFLTLACQAYIHDKRTNLNEREVMAAQLAGYVVADRNGEDWPPDVFYGGNGARGFYLTAPPFSIVEPETITINKAEYDALKAQVEKLGEGV